jgi:hypothetical protein
MKKQARILGVDDFPFKFSDKKVSILGGVYKGGNYIEGVIYFNVEKDGEDFTEKLIGKIRESKYKNQLRIIMLDGISFAGFNIADIKELNDKTGIPVIAVMRKKPDMKNFLDCLGKISIKNLEKAKKAGEINEFIFDKKKIYFQSCGINSEKAEEILRKTCTNSNLPEPIRATHLIASGIYYGESKKRA